MYVLSFGSTDWRRANSDESEGDVEADKGITGVITGSG